MNPQPTIDFYVLPSASGQKSWQFACQFIEKAYAEQKRVFVHTESTAEAERVDALLWTYRDDSFVPHAILRSNEPCPPSIQIGFGEAPAQHQDTLVNLAKNIPSFYRQFNHVIEIVSADPIAQQSARIRYKQYREQGCDINTIKLKATEL